MATFNVDKALWETIFLYLSSRSRDHHDTVARGIVEAINVGGAITFDDATPIVAYDDMVSLVRDMSFSPISVDHYQRAKRIAERLPTKPVSQDILDARDHLKHLPGFVGNSDIIEAIDRGEFDDNAHVVSFIAGLNTGRNIAK